MSDQATTTQPPPPREPARRVPPAAEGREDAAERGAAGAQPGGARAPGAAGGAAPAKGAAGPGPGAAEPGAATGAGAAAAAGAAPSAPQPDPELEERRRRWREHQATRPDPARMTPEELADYRERQERWREHQATRARQRAEEEAAAAARPAGPVAPDGTFAPAQAPRGVPAPARAARLRPRHLAVAISFALCVLLPLVLTAGYLFLRAEDQYASHVGFTVKSDDTVSSASSLIGGLISMTGGGRSDADILYRFIQSRDMADHADRTLDLRALYAPQHRRDPWFALDPEASREDLLRFWNDKVKVIYDTGTGLIEVRVNAFDPADAQRVAQTILDESTRVINDLSAIAREDTTRYARDDMALAEERLRASRLAVAEFRSRTQMVDPAADVAGQMSLIGTLQVQLAESHIELDVLRQSGVGEGDPRIGQIERRIGVIEERIRGERAKLGAGGGGPGEADYAAQVGEYERLRVDQEFAEKAYLAAAAAYDAARAEALRKSRYLAAWLHPTLPETAEYPLRGLILAMMALFLLLAWTVGVLVFYALRDRR